MLIDWYPPLLLITLHQEPATDEISDLLSILEHLPVEHIMLQRRDLKGSPCEVLKGAGLSEVIVEEAGLRFEVRPGVNQNSGFFLDMRPLRQWLRENSGSKSILNLFAYTCSLSVAALAGGASQVTSVDMSKPAISWGVKNHELNNHDLLKVKRIPHNVFKAWGRIRQFGRYDTIIIDPPTRQRGSFDVEKNYGAILKRISQLANPNADIIATVNSPYLDEDYLLNQMQRYQPACEFLRMMPASPEFEDKYPSRALKIYHYRFRR